MFEKTREYLDSLTKEELKQKFSELGFNFTITYKNFIGEYNYQEGDCLWIGRIINITDLVTFQADNRNNIKDEFHKAVDDYISFCKRVGKEI